MRHEVGTALWLGAAIVAAPSSALPTTPPAAAASAAAPDPAPGDDAASTAVRRALVLGQAGDCRGALAILDPLLPGIPAGATRSAAQTVRLSCLGVVGRAGEMPGVQQELAKALPKSPYVLSMGVLVAASQGKYDDAAERLAAIAQDSPDTLSMIPADSWRGIEQKLAQADEFKLRDKVVLALARADWQPAELPELRDSLAQGAIGALLEQGQASEARVLLDRVTIPELLTDMATERLYQPLWPAIEAKMGPAQGRSADRFAAVQLDAYARTPDDPHTLRDAVRAFGLIGRYDDASQVAAAVAVADGMDEDAVAAVRYDAQVMQAAGKTPAAIARLQPFIRLDPGKTPYAGSALLSLAELLDEAGQPAAALDVARGTLARWQDTLSPWGIAWLHRTETCALTALSRAAEARQAGDQLKAHAADNQAAAIEGLLCARRTEEAAMLAVTTLATVEGTDMIADQFQPDGAVWLGGGSRLRALWAGLLARADVRAAFEKRARVLPRAFWPGRMPRPLPHTLVPASDDASPTT